MTAQTSAGSTVGTNKGDLASAPLIFQLGLLLAATDKEHGRLDRPGSKDQSLMEMLVQREEDLWHVIAAKPAATLADAAVQICTGYCVSGILESCVWAGDDQQDRLHRLHQALHRICLSTPPLLAAAAGLDMEAMGWGSVASLRAAQLGGGAS